jgi:Tfp pilus assembly protein PilO
MRRGPNPRTYMLMAVGTFVLGLGASYMGYSQMTGVQGEVSALKTQVKDEKEVQAELDAAKGKLDECAAKLQHLEQGIPELAYVPTLMTELEKTGKQFGIKVLGVRPIPKTGIQAPKQGDLEPSAKKAYEELAIEVRGIGTYGSVMRWVNALQQFPKIIAARSVTLAPKVEPGKTQTDLDVTLELRAYVFPQANGSQPATTPTEDGNRTAKLGVNRSEG